jgi:cell division protein FtsL
MESVRTVHSLEGELVRLRESTKDALQQAWEEVETLQQQCAAHLEITTQLESDFVETKKKEEYWHKRCLEAEKQLMQNVADTGNQPSSKRSLLSHEKNFISWPSIRMMKNRSHDDNSSSRRTSIGSSQMMSSCKSLAYPEEDDKVHELELKMASRDAAVQSLERTVAQHVKAMHTMQAEMQCMMEAQRIKEKNAEASYLRKEDAMEKQITALHEAVEEKAKLIVSQKKRVSEYKVYIKELTHELERVLKILQVAEKKGINLRPTKIKI